MLAMVERVVPPILPWMLVTLFAWPLVWYLTRPAQGIGFVGGAAAVGVAVIFVITVAYLGPISFFFVFGFIVYRLATALKRGGSRKIQVLAGALAFAYIATGIGPVIRESRRDDADRVLRWPGTGPSQWILQNLEAKRDLPSLRKVLVGPDAFEASNAAAALGRIGVAVTDGPRILARLRLAEKDSYSEWTLDRYATALAKLLKRSPKAPKPTADDWQRLLAPPAPTEAGS